MLSLNLPFFSFKVVYVFKMVSVQLKICIKSTSQVSLTLLVIQKEIRKRPSNTLTSNQRWRNIDCQSWTNVIFIDAVSTLKWGCLFYINIWLFHQYCKLSTKMLLVSTQIQLWFSVDFQLIFNWLHRFNVNPEIKTVFSSQLAGFVRL